MAKEARVSQKRIQINQANARMVTIIAVSSAIVMFCLVGSRALLSQRSYQSRVISEKQKAAGQLENNVEAAQKLAIAYGAFVGTPTNVLGGNPAGSGERDGDNAKIVLDALPSKYDFPALATSLEKILRGSNYEIDSITGTDDEINQQKNASSPSPEPVEMPFEIGVTGSYDSMNALVSTLEYSIRPFIIQKLQFNAQGTSVQTLVTAKTFYQPEKDQSTTTKEVR